MRLGALTAIAAGVLSLLAIHLAYWMNMMAGVDLDPSAQCNPYIEGCVSTSGAVRSGPGIVPFKVTMLLVSGLMIYSWILTRRCLAAHAPHSLVSAAVIRTLGVIAALALVIYVILLGTDGVLYGWLRQYGVTVFLGFASLAQLLLVRIVWGEMPADRGSLVRCFLGVVAAQWAIGLGFVIKRLVLTDKELEFRIENILEWWFIVFLSLGFVLKGLILQRWSNSARN